MGLLAAVDAYPAASSPPPVTVVGGGGEPLSPPPRPSTRKATGPKEVRGRALHAGYSTRTAAFAGRRLHPRRSRPGLASLPGSIIGCHHQAQSFSSIVSS